MRPPLALVLLLLAVSLPHANAQDLPVSTSTPQMSVRVDDPGALHPGSLVSLPVIINYHPGNGALARPAPTEAQPEATEPTQIVLTAIQLPSWSTNVTFDPAIVNVTVPVPATNVIVTAMMVFEVVSDAPGLQRENVQIQADARPNGNIGPAQARTPEVLLRANIVARTNVTGPESLVVPGGRWTDVPYVVTNLGNYELTFKLNVTARPKNSMVEFPATVVIPRGGSAEILVRLKVPWTAAEFGSLELEATPLVGDEDGRPGRASVEVLGQSAVPNPPGLLIVAVALLGALARRRGGE